MFNMFFCSFHFWDISDARPRVEANFQGTNFYFRSFKIIAARVVLGFRKYLPSNVGSNVSIQIRKRSTWDGMGCLKMKCHQR